MTAYHVDVGLLFRRLADAGIRTCVIRNYDSLPDKIRNDLDLVVSEAERGAFRSIVGEFASSLGLRIASRADHGLVVISRFVRVDPNGDVAHLAIDEESGAGWWGAEYLSNSTVLAESSSAGDWLVPRPGHEAAMSLLTGLLIAGKTPTKHWPQLPSLIESDPSGFRSVLVSAFGRSLATAVESGVLEDDPLRLESLVGRLRRAHLLGALRADAKRWSARFALITWRQVRLKTALRGLAVGLESPSAQGEHLTAIADGLGRCFKGRTWLLGMSDHGPIGDYERHEPTRAKLVEGALRERLMLIDMRHRIHPAPRVEIVTIRPSASVADAVSQVVDAMARRPESRWPQRAGE